MNIGVTFLYISGQEELCGALKSYVVSCSDINSLNAVVENKVKEQHIYYPNYRYLGMEDIFVVSGEVSEGEFLGRTTYYELKESEELSKLLGNDDSYSLRFQDVDNGSDFYNMKLLYLNDNKQGKDNCFGLSVITVLKSPDFLSAKNKAIEIAKSDTFLEKIISNSVDSLERKNLKFIGIEDIVMIEEDVEKGGAYLVLYNKNIKSENELREMLLNQSEIKEICEDIF